MKLKIVHHLRRAFAGFGIIVLVCSASLARAQDLIVNSFDNAASVNYGSTPGLDWSNFRTYIYNYATAAGVWDPTQDSTGNTNSGSMYLTLDWPLHSDPNWNESWNDVQLGFSTAGTFDSSNYIAFEVDIKVDVAHSAAGPDGTYGAIELIVNSPWTGVVGWSPLIATNGWQHFTGYFSGIAGGSYNEAILGFISTGGGSPTNTASYWIDNIRFAGVPTVFTNQPPLSIGKAPPAGLTCICSQPGGTYQRQIVRTVGGNYAWSTTTAATNTATYSMNIAAFPGANYTGFEDQMFLVPQAGMLATPADNNIDWNSADVVALYVGVNPDHTATGTFQYKVNQSSSWNTSLVVTNQCASGPLGTWTLTFNNNTNVTLTAPDNTSTNFTIPAGDAALFQDPLFVYVGDQPNVNANIGQWSTISQVTVAGAAASISDNFTNLNAATWANDTSGDPLGIFITAPDAKYSITWPVPDTEFTNVFVTDNLKGGTGISQWLGLPSASTGWIKVAGTERLTIINQSTLNAAFGYAPTNCFFGLYHP